jgi:hypothetical protein
MTGSSSRTTCKPLFQKLEILTLPSHYILSLMRFLSTDLEIYKFTSSVHVINTRYKFKLHKPSTRLTLYQKGVYQSSIKVYNKFPDAIAGLVFGNKFFNIIKKYLIDKTFYSLHGYLDA